MVIAISAKEKLIAEPEKRRIMALYRIFRPQFRGEGTRAGTEPVVSFPSTALKS
jgi:hypothetical protein